MDRRVGRVGRIKKLEELDELAAAVAILHQGVNLAGQQVNSGQQAHRPMTLVFVVAREGRMNVRLGRQVGGRRRDRLDTRLLVVGDDRHRVARLLLRCDCDLLQELHPAIDAQHFGHLFRKLGIALLQVVAHLVRLDLLLIEDLAHRALRQAGEAGVSLRRSMLACVPGEQPRRPQFMRITQFLCLPASERRQPCLGFDGDHRLLAGARAIVQRRHRAFDHGPFNTTLNCLMMQSERLAHRKKRRVFPIRQESAPARPGSPVRFATALSTATSPHPHLRATTQSLAATLPYRPILHLKAPGAYIGARNDR